jgi:hypothetical protein
MADHQHKNHHSIKTNLADYSPKTQESIDAVIREMCDEHQSEELEKDIIALFEDILKFFSGRSEDFINFESLSAEQKKELYVEIKAVIALLKKLKGGIDKQEVIKLLSQGMISTFSKGQHKKHLVETFSLEDQRKLKETFARITIQQIHDHKIETQKAQNYKHEVEKIKNTIQQVHGHKIEVHHYKHEAESKKSGSTSFTEKIKQQNLEKKSTPSGHKL